MNQIIILLLCVIIISCSNKEELKSDINGGKEKVSRTDMLTNKNLIDVFGDYSGILPCADCVGIETLITLTKDSKFKRKTKYLGKDEKIFEEEGSFEWNDKLNKIILQDISSGPSIYLVGENHLVQLDMEGNKIIGDLADKYILNKKNDEAKINSLINTKWILTELRGKPVELKNTNKKIFLMLEGEKNKVHGFAGCNNFNGTYKLEGNGRIKFSENMAMTRMACPDMEIEQVFIKTLTQIDTYNLNENKLVLNKSRMAPLARFGAEQLVAE